MNNDIQTKSDSELQEELINLKKERLALFWEPLRSKEELAEHISTFLGIEFPDFILDEESTSTPMQFIWEVYEFMTTGKGYSRHVVAASRNCFKTLSTAVLQFYNLIHCRRDSVQISAELQQSASALAYVEQFLKIEELDGKTEKDNSRIKRLANLPIEYNWLTKRMDSVLKVVTATKKGANSSRASCLSGKTKILIATEKQSNGSNYIYYTLDGLYKRMNTGYKKSAAQKIITLSVDPETLLPVDAEIVAISRREELNRLVITTESGKKIECTNEHVFPVNWNGKLNYKRADQLIIGDLFLEKNNSSIRQSVRKTKNNHRSVKYIVKDFDPDSFSQEDIIEGSLLGDGCVYRKNQIKYSGNSCFTMTKTPKVRNYSQFIASRVGGAVLENAKKSGYTGQRLDGVATGQSEFWNYYRNRWYNENRKKIVPLDLKLTMPMFAIWFMDDGCKNGALASYSFSYEENNFLCKKINELFNYNCAYTREINKNNKIYYSIQLRFPDDQLKKYLEFIQYLHPNYTYKISKFPKKCKHCGELSLFSKNTEECSSPECVLKSEQKFIKLSKIISIKQKTINPVKRERWVYDIQVKDTHLFFANKSILTHNCLIYDETDLTPPEVLGESTYIADSERYTGFDPCFVYISSRKSNDGPLQKLIDEYENEKPPDLKLHRWSVVDIMKRCPETVCDSTKPAIAFMHMESLEVIWGEDRFNALVREGKDVWKQISAFEGCAVCPAFIACQGRSKKQINNQKTLRGHTFVGSILKTVMSTGGPSAVISQTLNLKPETSAIVFSVFNQKRNVLNYIEFYKWVAGFYFNPIKSNNIQELLEEADPIKLMSITPTKQDIYNIMKKRGWVIHYGVDWGLYDPAVVVVVGYHKASRRAAILHLEASSGYANEDWAKYIKANVYSTMPSDLVAPDMADPSSPTYFGRLEMACLDTKPSRIETGVHQLKSLIFNPFTQQSHLMVLDDGEFGQNKMLIEAFLKWSYLKMATGYNYNKFEDNDYTHPLDSLRYALAPFVENVNTKVSSHQGPRDISLPEQAAMGNQEAIDKIAEKSTLINQFKDHMFQEHGIKDLFKEKTSTADTSSKSGNKPIKFKF